MKTDNTTFPNGDPWKCVTCGVPEANVIGRTDTLDHPHTFRDGRRLLAGNQIVTCGSALLSLDECTPKRTFIYQIRRNWGTPYSPAETALPKREFPPEGNYTLEARASGSADVIVRYNGDNSTGDNGAPPQSITVRYHNFSDDRVNFLSGWEDATATYPYVTMTHLDWFSDLVRTCPGHQSTKTISRGGFHLDMGTLLNFF